MRKLTFLSICILCILSCGKEACYTYKGRILAFGTKEPVSDAVVNIIAGKDANALDPQVEWLLDSVRTDKEGRFEIEVNGGDYHRIGAVIKEGFFPDLGNQETYLFEDGNLANRDYVIDPEGTLHIFVEDDPNIVGEYIRYWGFFGADFTGPHDKLYKVRANRFSYIKYKKSESLNTFSVDSVFIKPQTIEKLHVKY